MAASNFSGPLVVTGESVSTRPVEVLMVPLTVAAAANSDFTFTLPACRVLRMTQRTNVAFTGNTVTLQMGSTAGGVDYVAAADIKALSAARAQTLVAAAAAALDAFAGGTVHGRIVQTATFTAVGSGVLQVEFQRTGS
jgi:hypothetical protein